MLRAVFLLVVILAVGCSGGQAAPAPTSPTSSPGAAPVTNTPADTPTITISSSGMTRLELTISVGQRVTFVNNDIRAHDVVGGIDPSHPDCPEIVQMGFLSPGQRGNTGVFTAARTCEYHDHTMLSVPAFQGRIIIK